MRTWMIEICNPKADPDGLDSTFYLVNAETAGKAMEVFKENIGSTPGTIYRQEDTIRVVSTDRLPEGLWTGGIPGSGGFKNLAHVEVRLINRYGDDFITMGSGIEDREEPKPGEIRVGF